MDIILTLSVSALCILKMLEAFKRSEIISVFNSKTITKTRNAVNDFEKFKTAGVVLPVIYETVLSYEPGELGNSDLGKRGADIYYSEEALSDPEFLETVLRSPFSVGTHEKNTGEHNLDLDGYPLEAFWDEEAKGVFVKGVLTGSKNVEYVKQNKDNTDFGTSAYLDFLEIEENEGVSPNGKPYTAIVKKLRCNHLAILPNPRDEHNVIVAMNSIEVKKGEGLKRPNVLNKLKSILKGRNAMEDEKKAIKEVIKEIASEGEKENEFNALKDCVSKNTESLEEIKESLNALKNQNKDHTESKNEDDESDDDSETVENEYSEEKEEEILAENARPSDAVIEAVSNGLGVTFTKAPSVRQIAKILDVKESSFSKTLSAINAKCKEIQTGSVKNGKGSGESTFSNILRGI